MVPFLTRGPSGDGRDAPPGIPLARLLGRAAEGGIHLKDIGQKGFGQTSRLFPRLRHFETPGLDPVLGRIGSLEVRLATTPKEIKRAQRLRYRVFYEEMAAIPTGMALLKRRDADEYDAVCDHLLVIDHDAKEQTPFRKPKPRVVGTYRLLRQEQADRHFGFYTAGEYDLGPVLEANAGKRLLELGRSCVLKPYRTKRTVELLWHGIWTYVLHHRIDAMLGCASLEGTDPDSLALPLSFLHHFARAPEGWRARALPGRHVAMDRLSREAIDPKAALHALPPLIKGYLRVGATFGDGAVVDYQFGTTDVFVVLPVEAIAKRYIGHFGAEAGRHAA
ncbi:MULTISPECIES: GNAT family N-acyltransferase [Methylobacterium]|jgi:putative hemolysin|uniref:GNAT family N-acetyltransferase n=1 Tax=Methylobacterium TaxID=407 RepID=UPI0008F42FC1|nr:MULTISPECIES: GNAT family N-acyltransferase [Methylobacterium]MBZ6416633.1 GNAT family N-acetyltransferase [Methylobacterium sp.]MBK3399822.1 GNAT family N-acetyltransferase [Methylobacterium ajmalii]MBK3407158.1 GNAT family N-acetyltransferase [Methylobacterium ajmalii]MBK3421496.1 GNAT family N-acetyltransferase [Methylobacterium ajmalii]SFF20313.1 Putative hemolysin [Methylobacterium sp. yr596]